MSEAPADAHAKPARDQWLAIEMRHLAALATVAREASFSGAAESLGYVQSAVSQQIAFLERVVERRLVERSGRRRSVTLTESGAVLLDHIEEILQQLRLAKADIDSLMQRPVGPARLGTASIFGAWLPAALLATILPTAGAAGWGRLVRGPSTELLDAVAAGRLDAAFVELPIASGPFFAMELTREPCVLVVPAEAALRSRCAEAVLERWSLVDVEDCRATQALSARLTAGGRPVRSVHAAESPASALPFVRARAAVAVMTRRDLPDQDDSLATLPLRGVSDRVLGLAWHRDHDDCPAVTALKAAARRAFPDVCAGHGSSA
jgi:DNA-binding transcriptional LysR family regulator